MSGSRAWAVVVAIVVIGALAAPTGTLFQVGAQQEAEAPVVSGHVLERRWVYVPANFQVPATVERVKDLLTRAQSAGYNGALISDVKFGRLEDGSLIDAYHPQLREVLAHGSSLGMRLVPAVAPFGYSEALLWHDPNLAEALPVRRARFVVRDARLAPYESSPVEIVNGDFDDVPADGHAFPGWSWQDEPGRATFVDRDVKHAGVASIRMEDLATTNPSAGNGRIHQRIRVTPFQNYHVSVWVRTRDFRGGDVRVLALGQNPSRTLQWNSVPVATDQEWTRFDVTFNSLTHEEVLFYFGVWGGGSGTIWWDSGSIEPAGLVNLVRRPGAPVRIVREADDEPLVEGQDVARLVDPEMGRNPWPGSYDAWHPPPVIDVPEGSRLAEGDVVRIDHYHTTTIYGHQVTASLTEPEALRIATEQLGAVRRAFSRADAFSGWFFSHDEIRMGGWDEAPSPGADPSGDGSPEDGSPGARLAHNVDTLYGAARQQAPTSEIYIWSDMFDPHHNAAQRDTPYYLVDGDWSGSWQGLASDVVVMNWNRGADRRPSAAFFAARGHEQMLAGYYDAAPDRWSDRAWLEDLRGIPGITGVMYTPWTTGYDHLEAWADHVWGDAEWVPVEEQPTPTVGSGTPEAPTPTAEPATRMPPTAISPTAIPPTAMPAGFRLWLPVVQPSGRPVP